MRFSALFLRPATTLWPPVLLGSQFAFNIGFYAVVPFLALFLRDDMLLSGGLIGLVLGLRTFSQQGMFIVGGALSDRFGAKIIILFGCMVRVPAICFWPMDNHWARSFWAHV